MLNVFCDCFGSFRDSVSSEFSWKDKFNSWLNFSGWEGSSLVESDEFWTFSGNSVESIMNERVHDVHGFLWDSDIWVYLFKNFVDIDWEGLNSSSSGFLIRWFSSLWCSSFFLSHFVFDLNYYEFYNYIWFKVDNLSVNIYYLILIG